MPATTPSFRKRKIRRFWSAGPTKRNRPTDHRHLSLPGRRRPFIHGRLSIFALLPLLSACASLYFRDAGPPPIAAPHTVEQWPYGEYWTGIVFNGAKIGFTHLRIEPVEEAPGDFTIYSEAALRFRFLMLDKTINISTQDTVRNDLTLTRFVHAYNLDGNHKQLAGRVLDGVLHVNIVSADEHHTQMIPLAQKVYPTSAIALYPVLQGLVVGRHYEYQVYDGETARLTTVTQDILGYEQSDLFEGPAFKIKTRMYGNKVTTWIDASGKPVFEMAMNGVLISHLESEAAARRYLALAALNKQEVLLEFSLVRSDIPIGSPRDVVSMRVALIGIPADLALPSDRRQHCEGTGPTVECRISVSDSGAGAGAGQVTQETLERYLRPSITVSAGHPDILRLAQEITADAVSRTARIEALIDWLQHNIEREAIDVFSALDVLRTRRAECQGHSYLYAALARSVGIPSRVVNGLVYSERYQGFLYHTWTESWLGNEWLAVDPTFGQINADATHIKLIEGETLAEVAPLAGLVGRLEARVISVEHLRPVN